MCMGHNHNHEPSIFDEPLYNDDIDSHDIDEEELLEDSFYDELDEEEDEDLYGDFIGYNPDYDDGDF